MIRIGLMGAHGQLGQSLLYLMGQPRADYKVIPFNRSQIDYTSPRLPQDLSHLLADHRIDVVINAAAYTDVNKAEIYPQDALCVNWQGPKVLAITCAQNAIPLIHISTDYVFDGRKTGSYSEDDEPHPLSFYGLSKLAGELSIREQISSHIIVRTSWLYSPFRKNFLKTMLDLATREDTLKIVSDQVGTPTSALDLARALLVIVKRITAPDFTNWGTYHYGGNQALSWHDYARMIFSAARTVRFKTPHHILPIPAHAFQQAAQRPTNSALSSVKIGRIFATDPSDLVHGIQETIHHLHTQGAYQNV